jgi:hypothetical protein
MWNTAEPEVIVNPGFFTQRHAHADATIGCAVRLAVHPKRADFAPGQEHDVPALHLEQVGAHQPGGAVDGRGLEQHVLGSEVQRRVG